MKKLFGFGFVIACSLVTLVALAPVACSEQPVECFAANYCHQTDCNGPIVRFGCITCGAGEVDDRQCAPDVGVECIYAKKCHQTDCNGPIVRSGCNVTCQPGEVEDLECHKDAGADGSVDAADAAADGSDAATDASDAATDGPKDAKGD